jgi:hypothetical protein
MQRVWADLGCGAVQVAEVFDIHDVLLRVMFYISIDDRLRNAVLVNSSWRDAALDASFWRELVDEQVGWTPEKLALTMLLIMHPS